MRRKTIGYRKPPQFTLRMALWFMAVVAAGCAAYACAERAWGTLAGRWLMSLCVIFCPLLVTLVARTCPGATLRRAAAAAGVVCIGLVALLLALSALVEQFLAVGLVILWIACLPWLLQGILIFATVAYWGVDGRRERAENANPECSDEPTGSQPPGSDAGSGGEH